MYLKNIYFIEIFIRVFFQFYKKQVIQNYTPPPTQSENDSGFEYSESDSLGTSIQSSESVRGHSSRPPQGEEESCGQTQAPGPSSSSSSSSTRGKVLESKTSSSRSSSSSSPSETLGSSQAHASSSSSSSSPSSPHHRPSPPGPKEVVFKKPSSTSWKRKIVSNNNVPVIGKGVGKKNKSQVVTPTKSGTEEMISRTEEHINLLQKKLEKKVKFQ